MRLPQLLHELVQKFVPLDQKTSTELQLDSDKFYNEIKEERLLIIKENQVIIDKNKAHENDADYKPLPLKALSLKHKVIGFVEAWYLRYFFALLYIYAVPAIKSYMDKNISGDPDDEEEEDDDEALYEEFKNFKRGIRK